MFSRHVLFVGLLAAALIGPAVYFNDSWNEWDSERGAALSSGSVAAVPAHSASWLAPSGLAGNVSTVSVSASNPANDFNPSRIAAFNSPPPTPIPSTLILPGDANGPDFNAVPLEFMPVADLAEIFRFDVDQNWVKQRWQRVSNSPGAYGLSGLRVPLVTGVNSNDLFGSLTYFFDAQQNLQKITFRGWSGNPERMVNLVSTNFGFKQKPTTAAGLYTAGRSGNSTGVLYLQNPTVIRAENPTQQVAMLLEINNPKGSHKLSRDVAAIVFE